MCSRLLEQFEVRECLSTRPLYTIYTCICFCFCNFSESNWSHFSWTRSTVSNLKLPSVWWKWILWHMPCIQLTMTIIAISGMVNVTAAPDCPRNRCNHMENLWAVHRWWHIQMVADPCVFQHRWIMCGMCGPSKSVGIWMDVDKNKRFCSWRDEPNFIIIYYTVQNTQFQKPKWNVVGSMADG